MKKKRRRAAWLSTKRREDAVTKHRQRASNSARAVREWLSAYKLQRGCADCGYKKYACALQLDHEGPKQAAISEIRTSIKRILEEIERGQCKVRCANCHAVATWLRKKGTK